MLPYLMVSPWVVVSVLVFTLLSALRLRRPFLPCPKLILVSLLMLAVSFALSRLDGQIGTYLALTSERLKGYDVVAAGIATHYVPETVLPELEARLAEIISDNKNISTDPFNLVNNVLEEFATDAPEGYEFSLSGKKREAIDSIFGQSSIEDIISALEADGSEWALKTKKTILGKPPLSVKVTFDALKRGKDLTITDALSKEYQLAKQFMSGDDFVEGVTSKLINKPATAPQWKPATLDEVTASAVSEFINKTDATDALEPITKEDFVDYPHKFGLPAEQDIKNFITGNDGSDRKFKVTKDKVFDHFQSLTRSKLGVARKIEEVLARKTTPDATDSTLLDWKH